MKKQIKLAGALLGIMMSATSIVNAQWLTTGNTSLNSTAFIGTTSGVTQDMRFKLNGTQRMVIMNATGNVGIGTTTPASQLEVRAVSSVTSGSHDAAVFSDATGTGGIVNGWYANGTSITGGWMRSLSNLPLFIGTQGTAQALTILNNGNVGIGVTSSTSKLTIDGAQYNSSLTTPALLQLGLDNGVNLSFDINQVQARYNGGASTLHLNPYGGDVNLVTYGGGNVGIGTTTPAYKLDVCGTIRAKEIRVETGWCDYVFANDYKLRPLSEVESFINENKHLPDVTSGPVIEGEGLEVGKVSSQMIRKIEELTLYVIDMNKNLAVKDKQISDLQKQMDSLKAAK